MNKEKLLKKWLKGALSSDELKEFEQLEDFGLNKQIIEEAKHFKASNFSKASSYETFKAGLPTSEEKPKVYRLKPYKAFIRIAAAIVISFGIYFTFLYSPVTAVQTLTAEQNTVQLPDASTVILNADSHIAYHKKKWKNNRTVNLEGEAFFKVAKGSKFDVQTQQGTVSVLGTEFSVNQRDNYYEVKCYEGLVQVVSGNDSYKLKPGQSYRILNGISSLQEVIESKPYWLDNISKFNSVPFYVVLNEFERQYKITLSIEDIDTDRIFTGGFVHNNLEQALESITVPLNISYKKESENKIILQPKRN